MKKQTVSIYKKFSVNVEKLSLFVVTYNVHVGIKCLFKTLSWNINVLTLLASCYHLKKSIDVHV